MKNPRLRIAVPFVCLALAVVGVLAYGLGYPEATLLGPALSRAGDPTEVMLTFDDGPSVPYTAQVLDVLRANHIKATFFLCGANAERYPDLVRRIRDEGHVIGNHTWSHPYLYLASRETIAAEIDRTQDVLEKITGTRPVWFRPPFGVRGFALREILKDRGMKMMLWSDRGHDGNLGAAGIAETTLTQLHPGAIILLHDGFEAKAPALVNRSATVSALPRIISGVRRAGYVFAPLGYGRESGGATPTGTSRGGASLAQSIGSPAAAANHARRAGRSASSSARRDLSSASASLLAAEGAAGSSQKPSSSRP
jgi:peptidoglycan/xylan/chitin deacetylase (PgdA/CDA1 family)